MVLDPIPLTGAPPAQQDTALDEIDHLDQQLFEHFESRFVVDPALTRPLVSFQANKSRPVYRWYKYKEAFSASLVEYLFRKYGITRGRILDPFAGSGTTLFVASAAGIDADGIELLPIGQQIIATKQILDSFAPGDFGTLRRWSSSRIWEKSEARVPLPELRITRQAYSEETRQAIEKYLGACQQENAAVQTVLRFALLCVLESISFTRKDGQYLRWDHRSGRKQGQKVFNKGEVLSFEQAICDKINEIVTDLDLAWLREAPSRYKTAPSAQQMSLFPAEKLGGRISLYDGSCLQLLPQLPDCTYDAVMTSPPYCNRYDYTRTYALELALLGVDEHGLSRLRQEMLSCTVENRAKDLLKMNPRWATALTIADEQELLQAILGFLEEQKEHRRLNNNGIPRMVRGYFYEMACVIAECTRVLKPNAPLFMVNDNVRYAGASVSVDVILSHIAKELGLHVDNILVLPNGKGNSSQQMGQHGRAALRKCVYIWRKP